MRTDDLAEIVELELAHEGTILLHGQVGILHHHVPEKSFFSLFYSLFSPTNLCHLRQKRCAIAHGRGDPSSHNRRSLPWHQSGHRYPKTNRFDFVRGNGVGIETCLFWRASVPKRGKKGVRESMGVFSLVMAPTFAHCFLPRDTSQKKC